MFFSINFNLMGKPNINLQHANTVSTVLQTKLQLKFIYFLIAVAIALSLGLYRILTSNFGLKLRAFGINASLLARLNYNTTLLRILGLGMSNALAALAGAFTADLNGFADLNMGLGVALVAIGSVVIGGSLVAKRAIVSNSNSGSNRLQLNLLGCFIGVFIYFFLLNLLLLSNINPINLKLFLGIALLVFLSLGASKRRAEVM
jgi:putative ABC transport system permease protein